MEDPEKVAKALALLNKGLPSKPWIAVNGNNYFPLISPQPNGTVNIDPNRGYSVKLFVNIATGEVRPFALALLERGK